MKFTGYNRSRFAPIPFIKRLTKRGGDFSLAALGIVATLPLLLIIPVLIKIEDGGPVLFFQERWGRNKKKITVYKFRTMTYKSCANGNESVQSGHNDARITRVGIFLRKSGLDELPQLVNILKGEMSFVGPRSLPINEKQISEDEMTRHLPDEMIPGFEERSFMKPGLTGSAQVYADRTIPRKKKFKYDLFYRKKQSLWLDIRLIVISAWISFIGRRT
jgi:lipopolysaccharide/colanic/teichoic acid biosynthesis glycosyltransferase